MASPSCAVKQNRATRCRRPPSGGPSQRRRLLKEAIFHLFWAMRAKKRIREGLDIRRELLSAGQIGFAGDVGDGGAAKIGGDAGLDETLAHQGFVGRQFSAC